jgi:hypothetical protein
LIDGTVVVTGRSIEYSKRKLYKEFFITNSPL